MEVRFQKLQDGRAFSWTALRRSRSSPIEGPVMAAGADIPHDLAHFVIEAELGLERGFWGCVADGASFGFRKRKRTSAGKDVINDYVDDLAAAERVVNDMHFAWRRGVRVECQHELDVMRQRWQALGNDEELALRWPLPTARDRRTRSRR